ncbi:hypothetical protein L2E82_29784 [Cichorium intybus]|uniref:Uncharacterized protein n=1 Tax=Cichorium intybus TaxID=13427 RepID=A0ACB9CYK6_CICIN|nr:hypothetical protein L2E82_29784 [Cichorium intybus]
MSPSRPTFSFSLTLSTLVFLISYCWDGAVCIQRSGVKSGNLFDGRDGDEQLVRRENRQQLVWFYIDVAVTGGTAGAFGVNINSIKQIKILLIIVVTFLSLYLISLGQGGYNPSLQAFCADQIDTEDELPTAKSDDKKSMFFQWWYFGVCIGSLLGVSIMLNIQDSIGWGLGFAMPAMAVAVSIVMFSYGSRFYAYSHDQSNDVKSLVKVVQAVKCSVSKFVHSKTEEKSSLPELE